MFHFHSPWFALLLPLPLMIRWLLPSLLKEKNAEAAEISFPAVHRLKSYSIHKAAVKRTDFFFLSLLLISWILLIISLMQPE